MAAEENNSIQNLWDEFERVSKLSKARNPEMKELNNKVKTALNNCEKLVRDNETKESEIHDRDLAIKAAEAEISELNSTQVGLLQESRKNKIIMDAYQHHLAPDTTEYHRIEGEIARHKQNKLTQMNNVLLEEADPQTWKKMNEKKDLLDKKLNLEMENRKLDYHIKSVLEMKHKEMYPNQLG